MTTLTQVVDTIVAEVKRRDLTSRITTFANQTIREVHAQPNQLGRSLTFKANLHERILIPDVDTGFVWPIPEARNFQLLSDVWYQIPGVAPLERTPSSAMENRHEVNGRFYFYRSGDSFVFDGYGGTDAPIMVAYHSFPRRLTHFLRNAPVLWNEEEQRYEYSDEYNTTPEKRQEALDKSTNWVLERWTDVILEGVRAKTYKSIGDDGRARLSYSLYESSRPQLVAAESYEYIPRVTR